MKKQEEGGKEELKQMKDGEGKIRSRGMVAEE